VGQNTNMATYQATFEVDSKSDTYAVERILDQAYDAVREESRSVREGSTDSTALLESFKTLREGAKGSTSGTLIITYEEK